MKNKIKSTEDLYRDPEFLDWYYAQTLNETRAELAVVPKADKVWRYWETRKTNESKK